MSSFKKSIALLLMAVWLLSLAVGCAAENSAAVSSDISYDSSESTAPPEQHFGQNDVTALEVYAVTELLPDDPRMSAVIAVDGDGNPCMTNADLQVYYWFEFYNNFLNSMQAYLQYLQLDYTQSLSKQPYPFGDGTWEQYFLTIATESFARQYAFTRAAEAAGYTLPEDIAQRIDDLTDPNGEFAANAAENGYESAEAMLQDTLGAGASLEAYQAYVRSGYISSDYYQTLSEEMEATLTDADIEAFYDENAAHYEEERLPKVYNVSARHILIAPDGDKDAELEDWTEEQWAEAEEKANEVYALWEQDPTEENFAALAEEYSSDGGSNTNGGIYEDFAPDWATQLFSDWCFDPARSAGDVGIVRTPLGYHIIYFIGQTQTRAWFDTARDELLQQMLNECTEELLARYPVSFDFTQMCLFDVIAHNYGEPVEG